jgi:5-methylthioadenosine/S-adenosylhomocysteine deaminase
MLRSILVASPGAPVRRATVTLRGSRIAAVTPDSDSETGGALRLAVPGLVNAHTHLFQTMARGLAPGLSYARWHREVMRPLYQALTTEDVYVFTLLGALDALRGGATAVLNFQAYPNDAEACLAAAEAIAKAGLRGVHVKAAYGAQAPPEMLSSRKRVLADAEALLRMPPVGGRVRFWVGVPTVIHAPADWLQDLMALAVAHGARMHLHLAESEAEADRAAQVLGMREVTYLERLGMLRRELVVAHGVALTAEEIALLAERNVGVVHCPVSNLYLRSGIARIGQMRRQGVVVALGTDGPASNDSQDMLGTMKMAALVAGLCGDGLSADDVLAMATLEGARLLDLRNAGRLSEGATADVTLVSLASAATAPVHHPVNTLVFACTPADIEAVIIDGEARLENGRVCSVDERAVVEEAQRRAGALLRRAGLDRLRDRGVGW